MTDRFVSLHRHGSFSLFDGLDVNVRAADFAAKLGQPALALTDHGVTYGLIDHYRLARERGVKPIMGCEVYVVDTLDKESPRRHLTVLVQDQAGYRNLMRLVTKSYQQMYYKPRVTYDDLEAHQDGLVVLSGCPSGHIGKALEAGDLALAESYFVRLASVFGDRFFAEVQHHDNAAPKGPYVYELACKHGVSLVATPDSHYVEAQDKQAHDVVLKLKASGKGEENPTYGEGFHMVTRLEMRDLMRSAHPWMSGVMLESCLDQTVEIADMVNFEFEKPASILPPLWDEPQVQLLQRAQNGMVDKKLRGRRAYEDRLGEELRVVCSLGYSEYFLLCADVTGWARQNSVLIGPRGSVCGSLLAYALGITHVDPLVHGTMFERFLHEEKKSHPDIDLDVDSRRQADVLKYVMTKFSPYAYPISSFGRWGPGNVSNNLARAYELSDERRRAIRRDMAVLHDEQRVFVAGEADLMKFSSFRATEDDIPGFCRVASRLYSQVLYIGKHPGGVAFCSAPHESWFAVSLARGEEVCAANYVDVEHVGLLKMDFLGLDAVASVAKTIEAVEARHGERIDPSEIPLNDAETLRRFTTGDTDGVFQFETRGAREILKAIEPESFLEVAAATALNRPGVLANLEAYVSGKRGE